MLGDAQLLHKVQCKGGGQILYSLELLFLHCQLNNKLADKFARMPNITGQNNYPRSAILCWTNDAI